MMHGTHNVIFNTLQYDARYTQRHINTLQYDARYTQRHINSQHFMQFEFSLPATCPRSEPDANPRTIIISSQY